VVIGVVFTTVVDAGTGYFTEQNDNAGGKLENGKMAL
jgi:hypothetical protein